MFVTGIPNGTSLDIQRGTALFLVKNLVMSAKLNEAGSYNFDKLRITQLSGCLGIEPEAAKELCIKVINGEIEEQVIDKYTAQSEKLKEEAVEYIKQKLTEVPR